MTSIFLQAKEYFTSDGSEMHPPQRPVKPSSSRLHVFFLATRELFHSSLTPLTIAGSYDQTKIFVIDCLDHAGSFFSEFLIQNSSTATFSPAFSVNLDSSKKLEKCISLLNRGSKFYLKRLRISFSSDFSADEDDELLSIVLFSCPHLDKLEVSGSFFNLEETFSAIVVQKNTTTTTTTTKSKNSQSSSLNSGIRHLVLEPARILSRRQQQRHYSTEDPQTVSKLQKVLENTFSLFPHLRSLSVRGFNYDAFPAIHSNIPSFGGVLPNLSPEEQLLLFNKATIFSEIFFSSLVFNHRLTHNLSELVLDFGGGSIEIGEDSFEILATSLPVLTSITLRLLSGGSHSPNENSIRHLGTHNLRFLETLKLSEGYVSPSCLKGFVKDDNNNNNYGTKPKEMEKTYLVPNLSFLKHLEISIGKISIDGTSRERSFHVKDESISMSNVFLWFEKGIADLPRLENLSLRFDGYWNGVDQNDEGERSLSAVGGRGRGGTPAATIFFKTHRYVKANFVHCLSSSTSLRHLHLHSNSRSRFGLVQTASTFENLLLDNSTAPANLETLTLCGMYTGHSLVHHCKNFKEL